MSELTPRQKVVTILMHLAREAGYPADPHKDLLDALEAQARADLATELRAKVAEVLWCHAPFWRDGQQFDCTSQPQMTACIECQHRVAVLALLDEPIDEPIEVEYREASPEQRAKIAEVLDYVYTGPEFPNEPEP